MRSTTRLEYPHSLSYQARVFTRLAPSTSVAPASNILEWGLPIMSEETTGG